MKTKLLLTIVIVMCLSLPLSARLITLFPTELEYGSVAVGDTGWQDVRFRYSGPDSGFVEIKFAYKEQEHEDRVNLIQDVFGVYRIRPGSGNAQETIGAIYNAVKSFRQDFGEDPPSVERLIELVYITIPDSISRQWEFNLIGQDPITQIEAVSTDEMPYGAGHVVLFDIQVGRFYGWLYEFDGKFELVQSGVRTVEVWFKPWEVTAYGDTLNVTAETRNGYVEHYQVICTGNGGLEVIDADPIPVTFGIHSAFPNPFNSTTNIAMALPSPSEVRLSIIGIDGREVAVLKEGYSTGGSFKYVWNAENNPAGTYFVRLVSGDKQAVKAIFLSR